MPKPKGAAATWLWVIHGETARISARLKLSFAISGTELRQENRF